jgi:oxygen-independent coproporphyrinogen III oxidase
MDAMNARSLYLHIPFCRQRCAYCDFNTYTSVGGLQDAYVAALTAEIRQVGRLAQATGPQRPLHTLFFGGGTPSLLAPAAVRQVVTAVAEAFGLADGAEITLEANPDTVDAPYLRALYALGVNRLSFGVQSALPDELALLGRTHDFAAAATAVAQARAAGFDNLSLDLIYGLPGQTLGGWRRSLEAALALAPPHLSLYCLTIEPGTPMAGWLRDGRIQPPDSDLAAAQYELACAQLAARGFAHYEISNWALPGYVCRHNLTYWRNQEYLGLGAGAHGCAAGYRYAVVKQPRVFIRRMAGAAPRHFPLSAAVADHHAVDEAEAMSDTVLTQLRLLHEGLDLDAFSARFGRSLDAAYDGTVTQLIGWGLLKVENGRLLLTERGRFLSNQVFYRFM